MIFTKSRCLEDEDRGSAERLLAVEGGLWTGDEEPQRLGDLAVTLLHFTILGIIFLVGILVGFFWRGDLDGLCSEHVSQYSPLIRDVGVKFGTKEFNGSLLKENIFRQDASPEVDAAWESLGVNYRAVRISLNEASESNIASDQVRIREEYGGGYPAYVEGLHHLHCLNVLRKSLYYNYDYYHEQAEGVFTNNNYIVRHQVSHCLDILRQQLMCAVDTGVLGQVWIYPEDPEPFINFNTQHKCKNFEEIRDWAEANQLPEDAPEDFLQPPLPGQRVLKEMP
ncbi:hypothetical protein N7468_000485 [Penicillium chermesinum]|uniref:Tat pathway signal sequence n=1 Tax=Penicillium chermesinum TaxID=63820 RepID=A0A9W9TYW8_9EURO|nr:uncharacterized protein N7468_000485 [Penicillium chermesinum]KAJ5249034.1 hypothetical protein N7468_000485 [Penicillium chermesinum]KAJ6151141.1 hypothetical protein N7470_007735 [Penicillium chermesinum]